VGGPHGLARTTARGGDLVSHGIASGPHRSVDFNRLRWIDWILPSAGGAWLRESEVRESKCRGNHPKRDARRCVSVLCILVVTFCCIDLPGEEAHYVEDFEVVPGITLKLQALEMTDAFGAGR